MRSAQPAAWHARPADLARFVTDLIAGELAHLRPGGSPLPERPWPYGLALDEEGLGLDSLERLSIASALNEALHLHESGLEDLLMVRRRFGEWMEVAAAGLAACDATLTFRTSGSSGQAKPCAHALVNLQQEVEHLATLTAGATRVLASVPAQHIYGFLFTVLLPAQLNLGEVLDVRRVTPQALAKKLRPGDLLVSHPAHWALLARHAGPLPPGVHGVTSSAPCPDDLARALASNGLARLTQVYGSSETGGIATREAAGACYRLMPFWSRHAEVEGRLWRHGSDGTRRAHDLQDRVAWVGRDGFEVRGRLDDAVQVAGTNVHPAHVRRVLLDHPQVADAAVRLMRPEEGARLKAFVVPTPGADPAALQVALWAWTESRLSAPERPKALTVGAHLPRNAMGKLADWAMAATCPVTAPEAEPAGAMKVG